MKSLGKNFHTGQKGLKYYYSCIGIFEVNIIFALTRCQMSSISITKLYELLSFKIGKEPAEVLTLYIEEKIKDEFSDHSQLLATKVDLANTRADLIKWMFVFLIGQTATILGIIFLFLKK
jgi:hypothetical protein